MSRLPHSYGVRPKSACGYRCRVPGELRLDRERMVGHGVRSGAAAAAAPAATLAGGDGCRDTSGEPRQHAFGGGDPRDPSDGGHARALATFISIAPGLRGSLGRLLPAGAQYQPAAAAAVESTLARSGGGRRSRRRRWAAKAAAASDPQHAAARRQREATAEARQSLGKVQKAARTFAAGDYVNAVALSTDGGMVASCAYGEAALLQSTEDKGSLKELRREFDRIDVDHDGTLTKKELLDQLVGNADLCKKLNLKPLVKPQAEKTKDAKTGDDGEQAKQDEDEDKLPSDWPLAVPKELLPHTCDELIRVLRLVFVGGEQSDRNSFEDFLKAEKDRKGGSDLMQLDAVKRVKDACEKELKKGATMVAALDALDTAWCSGERYKTKDNFGSTSEYIDYMRTTLKVGMHVRGVGGQRDGDTGVFERDDGTTCPLFRWDQYENVR